MRIVKIGKVGKIKFDNVAFLNQRVGKIVVTDENKFDSARYISHDNILTYFKILFIIHCKTFINIFLIKIMDYK